MCLNQHCVHVSNVDTVDCGDCSMHGVSMAINLQYRLYRLAHAEEVRSALHLEI